MNALIARQAARHGTASAIRIGLAAPVVDGLYMVLVVFGLLQVVDLSGAARAMAAVGAAVMLFLAVGTARVAPEGKAPPARFATMFLLSASNPVQLLWWASAGPSLLAGQGVWGAGGFLAAIFGWVLAWSWLMAHGARRWTWFTAALTVLSADALLYFAAALALEAFPP